MGREAAEEATTSQSRDAATCNIPADKLAVLRGDVKGETKMQTRVRR